MLRSLVPLLLLAWSGTAVAQTVDGAATYKRCAVCHLPSGAGMAGTFPPLTSHLGRMASSVAGREYLVMVLSAGVTGEIKLGGQSYRGFMPAQGGLKDAEMAAVLNHILSAWSAQTLAKGWVPFTDREVRTVRDKYKSLRAADVRALRDKIPAAKGAAK